MTAAGRATTVTDPDGSTSTLPATLTVVAPLAPSITTQPNSVSVEAGDVAIFTAAATGSPTPSIQWQINTGSGWTDLSDSSTVAGSMTDTLQYTTNANGTENGDQFRAEWQADAVDVADDELARHHGRGRGRLGRAIAIG